MEHKKSHSTRPFYVIETWTMDEEHTEDFLLTFNIVTLGFQEYLHSKQCYELTIKACESQ